MRKIRVFKSGIHMGEEAIIEGSDACAIIYLSGCHLACNFCYTPETSLFRQGNDLSQNELFTEIDTLLRRGAKSLSFVTPTHYWNLLRPIVLKIKTSTKPHFPIMLKTSGFETTKMVREMSKLSALLIPDFKVFTSSAARKVSLPPTYGAMALEAIAEAQKELPKLIFSPVSGKLLQGVVVRHLLMPGFFEESIKVIEALSAIEFQGYLNLMTYFLDKSQNRLINANPKDLSLLIQLAESRGIRILTNGREHTHTYQQGESCDHKSA